MSLKELVLLSARTLVLLLSSVESLSLSLSLSLSFSLSLVEFAAADDVAARRALCLVSTFTDLNGLFGVYLLCSGSQWIVH